jgi:hypothetical protein
MKMSKKSPTSAPSMNLATPSASYHPNPGKLPKTPGNHSAVKNLGVAMKGSKSSKC